MSMPSDGAPEQPDTACPGDRDDQSPRHAPVPPAPISPTESISPAQSGEDTDLGWGDYTERDDGDRLLRDRPPHWDDV